MNAQMAFVKKRERVVILRVVRLCSRFFICPEISRGFLACVPVVDANVDSLPVGTCLDSQKDAVDSRRTRRLPRALN